MKFKKFICLLIAAAVVMSSIPFTASAFSGKTTAACYPVLNLSPYEYKNQEEALREAVNVEVLREHLLKFIMKAKSPIDVTSFGIPERLYSSLSDLIWYGMPEAFNADGISFSLYDGKIAEMNISYRSFADTEQEYKKCFKEFKASADRLLEGIEGNKALSAEYKALLLHDRLCMLTEYCYGDLDFAEYTAYGALVKRSAVCQGYAMAYMYLLRRVGIDNYYCASESLDHAWNIVYINDIPYHVDVTRDDMDWGTGQSGISGGVRHKNFLRSTEGIFNSDHRAYDYDDTPCNTKYDDYFWQKSDAEFCLVGGQIYYINNEKGKLVCATDKKILADIERIWYSGQFSYWNGNYSRLATDGDKLYYSLDDGIYSYTISNGKTKEIFAPDLKSGFNIFGFTIEDGYIVCDINNEPPGGSVSRFYREKDKLNKAPAVMTGIEADASKGKIHYVGDSFDPKGITVKAVYSDGSKKTLTKNFEFSGFSSDTAGTKTVSVTYKAFSAKFKVKVKSPSITIKEASVSFKEHESVAPVIVTEPAGQTLSWSSKNGIAAIKDGKITASEVGEDVITISFKYNGKTYKEDISVNVLCAHSSTAEHKEIPATTESTGYTKGIYCNDCKKYISGHKVIPMLETLFQNSDKAILDGKNIKIVAGTNIEELLTLAPEGAYIKDTSGNTVDVSIPDNKVGTGFILTLPDKSEYTVIAYGDVDGDGAVTASDARLALRASVGLESYNEVSPCYIAAMVESADVISASDARIILRASVGLEKPESWLK